MLLLYHVWESGKQFFENISQNKKENILFEVGKGLLKEPVISQDFKWGTNSPLAENMVKSSKFHKFWSYLKVGAFWLQYENKYFCFKVVKFCQSLGLSSG